jgi:hypothetical protein
MKSSSYRCDMSRLADFPDATPVRVVPCAPPLSAEDAAGLSGALDRLFAQFAREGRVRAWAIEVQLGGAALIIAYQPGDDEGHADLSGCSRDKIAGVLAAWEARCPTRTLSAPPILIAPAGSPRCVDRTDLRALVQTRQADDDTPVYDTTATTIGVWRSSPRRAGDTPLAAVIARARTINTLAESGS